MSSDENNGIKLSGRYSRSIQIYLSGIIAFELVMSISMMISHSWQEWYLFLPPFILLLPMLVLYLKPITVVVDSGRLYIRDKRIDVTQKIKTVQLRDENLATVRFNILYQLNVKGSSAQISSIVKQLKRH